MNYKRICKKYKDFILYAVFGVLTTLVNMTVYWVLAHIFKVRVMPSTICAWVAAVLFAYVTNRKWVFHSKAHATGEIIREVVSFFTCRILTGIVDWGCMLLFVAQLHMDDVVIKFAANVLVIILNYIASKLIIFKHRGQKNAESKKAAEKKHAEPKRLVITKSEDDFTDIINGNRLIGEKPLMKNSKIIFNGKNNILFCEDQVCLFNSTLTFQGDNSVIYLSKNRCDYKLNITIHHNSVFFSGKNNYFNGVLNAVLSEYHHVLIGSEALFSHGIWIRNADPHLVYSCETMERINPTQSIFIGPHVWVGQSAMILKGSRIGAGSIIGAMSLVTGKEIPPNTSWGGNPAKLLKSGIFWEGSCVHAWTEEKTEKARTYQDDEFIFIDKSAEFSYDEIDQKLTDAEDVNARLACLQEVKKYFE